MIDSWQVVNAHRVFEFGALRGNTTLNPALNIPDTMLSTWFNDPQRSILPRLLTVES